MQSNGKVMLIDPNQTPEQAINNFGSYFARSSTTITSNKQPTSLEDSNVSNVAFTFYDVDTLIILKQITIPVSLKSKDQVKKYVNVKQLPELPPRHYISVNNNNFIVKESEAGFINVPKTIGEYEFTGKTEFNDGKDVQTHIYKLVEKPVTPTPDPNPEPKPKTPKKKRSNLPDTGEAMSIASALAAAGIIASGLACSVKARR